MQKNYFCPLPNKILVYEETDTISQSIFNSKRHLFTKNHSNNKYINKDNYAQRKYFYAFNENNAYKNIIINTNIIFKYEKYFKKNNNIFFYNYLCKNYNFDDLNKKGSLIEKYYSFKDSKIIFPNRAFYFRHHLEFLEKPNLISNYFNNVEKFYGIKKLIEYQNSKKKEGSSTCRTKEEEGSDQKIFDTNVLEQIENYSTTITQASNNEKLNTITPFEIFRRCEENKRLIHREKNNEKINLKNFNKNNKDKDSEIDKDVKSVNTKITFSESGISVFSKNVIDDSLIKNFVKDLSEEPKRFKPEGKKMISNFLNKKKEVIQKIVKFHKNINCNLNPKVNCINRFIKKEIKKETKISTSTNKKNKKIILDSINQNIIVKNKPKQQSFIKNIKHASSNSKKKLSTNLNYPSFNLQHQRKVVFNLKKSSCKKKRHTVQTNYNIKNNINDINKKNSNLVSISINNVDDLLKFFLTSKNEKMYASKEKEQKLKKQNKKNSALTFVNNVIGNNSQQKSIENEEKYKKIKKSKSPSIRLFLTTKEKNDTKKRKSVLYPEQNGPLLMKSMNLTNRKNNLRNKHKHNNAVTLSQNFDSIMKNYLK